MNIDQLMNYIKRELENREDINKNQTIFSLKYVRVISEDGEDPMFDVIEYPEGLHIYID